MQKAREGRSRMQNGRKNLALFLFLVFSLPLVCLFFEQTLKNAAVRFVLYGIQAASPTIAAAFLLCRNGQAKAFVSQSFCKGPFKTAVLLPAALACATILPAKLLFCCLTGAGFAFQSISLAKWVVVFWALFAEEAGWRGYLQPLLKRHAAHPWAVPGVVGVVWCLWHYHFYLQAPLNLPPMLFLLSCIVESYLYTFLMDMAGGDLLSAMVYHFSWNLLANAVGLSPAQSAGSSMPYLILVGLEMLALALLWRVQKARPGRQSR